MRNYFTFAGRDCRDFSLYINGHKTFNSPERNYSLYDIPGRSGSIAEDDGSMKNVELAYESSFIFESFDTNFSNLKNFLLSQSGYQRLVDTYHPDEYRLAIFRKVIEPTMNESNEVGAFDLVFECQPQRYLLSGENQITVTFSEISEASDHLFHLNNPTLFASEPKIVVVAPNGGTLSVNNITIEIDDLSPSGYSNVVIDSSIKDCYENATHINQNGYVTMTNYTFPVLKPGDNEITFDSDISRITITPRWFRI